MRIEAMVRGEVVVMDLTAADFCPECCGTLAETTDRGRPALRCQSCGALFREQRPPEAQ